MDFLCECFPRKFKFPQNSWLLVSPWSWGQWCWGHECTVQKCFVELLEKREKWPVLLYKDRGFCFVFTGLGAFELESNRHISCHVSDFNPLDRGHLSFYVLPQRASFFLFLDAPQLINVGTFMQNCKANPIRYNKKTSGSFRLSLEGFSKCHWKSQA